MENRAKFAHLILPESVRATATEANGSGWSHTYDSLFFTSTSASAHNFTNGFLLRLQLFHVLHPLYMPPGSRLVLDSTFQLHHFPPAHLSSFPLAQCFVLSTLQRLGAPTSDPDPLARLLFSFARRHAPASASAVVPFYISFTVTTVLRSVDEAVDWVHGGSPESHVVRTLRSTYQAISQLRDASFHGPFSTPESCAVCLEGFEDERLVSRLPCSHHYHFECVSRWLRFDHRCPVCRSPMPWVQTLLPPEQDHPQRPQIAPPAGFFTGLGLFFKQLFKKLFSTFFLKL